MKTTIYACYLPDSTTPDYVGSHMTEPPDRSAALQWRYANCTYLGQGVWIDKAGILVSIPRANRETPWGRALLLMSAAERLAIRVETVAEVETSERWKTEAHFLREYRPRFNALLPQSANDKRAKWNMYCRSYRKDYLARNPEKAAAKRIKDRERIAARRAAAKQAPQERAESTPLA